MELGIRVRVRVRDLPVDELDAEAARAERVVGVAHLARVRVWVRVGARVRIRVS